MGAGGFTQGGTGLAQPGPAPSVTGQAAGVQHGTAQTPKVGHRADGVIHNQQPAQEIPMLSATKPDIGTDKEIVQGMPVDKANLEAATREGKGTKKGRNYCHRCCSKGHVLTECTTVIFCHICESDDHVAAKCPLKKNRPMAYMVGSGIDNLGFFYIPHGPVQMSKKDGNTALVKVHGGNLTEEQLVGHL